MIPLAPLPFCPSYAGSDHCLGPIGHDGDHWTLWGTTGNTVRPVMYWRGDEPWAHKAVV